MRDSRIQHEHADLVNTVGCSSRHICRIDDPGPETVQAPGVRFMTDKVIVNAEFPFIVLYQTTVGGLGHYEVLSFDNKMLLHPDHPVVDFCDNGFNYRTEAVLKRQLPKPKPIPRSQPNRVLSASSVPVPPPVPPPPTTPRIRIPPEPNVQVPRKRLVVICFVSQPESVHVSLSLHQRQGKELCERVSV